nr:LytTR family DNA-binding domain-containing protein [Burkholderia lata]
MDAGFGDERRHQRDEQARVAGQAHAWADALAQAAQARDAAPNRWLTAGVKDATRLISVDDVLYFQASEKYTEVVAAGQRLVIRTPLKELMQRLDPERLAQVHRGVIVAYAAIDRVERDLLGRLRIRVRGQREMLPVSRAYAGLFRQM